MPQAKSLLVAFMPFTVHLHNLALDVVQPCDTEQLAPPFMRDIWRFVDPGPPS